jgi:hypothetical protein
MTGVLKGSVMAVATVNGAFDAIGVLSINIG